MTRKRRSIKRQDFAVAVELDGDAVRSDCDDLRVGDLVADEHGFAVEDSRGVFRSEEDALNFESRKAVRAHDDSRLSGASSDRRGGGSSSGPRGSRSWSGLWLRLSRLTSG